jgi:hypothetical protein
MIVMLSTLRALRHIAFAIVFAIALVPTATCLAAVAASTPQMPCHESEQAPIHGNSTHLNCCPGDTPNTQSPAPTQQLVEPMSVSLAPVALLPLLADLQPAPSVEIAEANAGALRPPGIPTYVFVSSFRI